MPRARTGSFWRDREGNLYARVTWTDEAGKTHDRKRKALSGTKTEARRLIKELLDDVQENSEAAIDGANLTIGQLVAHYKQHYAIPAEYDKQGIKKAGMRSYRDAQRKADVWVSHFGPNKKIRTFTYGDLYTFKITRLRTPTHKGTVRTIASVHRDLEVGRRMFRVAVQNQWLRISPFNLGDPLIQPAEEAQRETIATKQQEKALLAACDEDKQREHLKPFLILAFDTGFRPIEMTSLRVRDVDFEDNSITAVSYKGKRRRERQFEMTHRVRSEMEKLCAGKKPNDLIFKFKSVKRSFATAKKIAGLEGVSLEGFRLYDVRHTATTRLVRRGYSLEESGKLMGHSQPKTTWRYMHVDKTRRRKAAELLEQDDE